MNKKNNIRFFLTPDGIVGAYEGIAPEELKRLEELQYKVMAQAREKRKFLESVPQIPKKTALRKGRKYYLLGREADGTKWWLEEPEYNCCDWYTSFGHIITFRGNRNPETATDINTLTHFKEEFLNGDIHDSYKMSLCGGVTLSDKELWTVLELFKEAYLLEAYYELMYIKGAHISSMPYWAFQPISSQAFLGSA